MSISRSVYLRRTKMLVPEAWAEAIRAAGFPVTMDTDFDVERHSGFLPCRYDDREGGFEYSFSTVAESGETPDIGDRDVCVSFVTHSSMRELATAVVAAAVLCAETDGVLHDEEAGELIAATDALGDARELIASIANDLD